MGKCFQRADEKSWRPKRLTTRKFNTKSSCEAYEGRTQKKQTKQIKPKEKKNGFMGFVTSFLSGSIWWKLGAYIIIFVIVYILLKAFVIALAPLLPYLIILGIVGGIIYLIIMFAIKQERPIVTKIVEKEEEEYFG